MWKKKNMECEKSKRWIDQEWKKERRKKGRKKERKKEMCNIE